MGNTGSYDVIIVGSGSAGCALANRLSADPARKVLLLEAGPTDSSWLIPIPVAEYFILKSKLDWNFETEPEPQAGNRRMYAPRGKVIGGSSSINGMIYVRGHAEDYNGWERLGASGWSYDDVKPYFMRMENYNSNPSQERGSLGPLQVTDGRYQNPMFDAFMDAGRALGFPVKRDYNLGDNEGFSWVQYTQYHDRARRCSSAAAYLHPAKNRSNLTVETGAHVTKLDISNRRCHGLSYARNGQVHKVSAKNTVLSAGAYGSPQILLLSGVGPADELRAMGIPPVLDLPGVGRNLQDHCGTGIQFNCTKRLTYKTFRNPFHMAVAAWQLFVQNKGPFTVFPMPVHAFVRSSENEPRPNLQIQFFPVSTDEKGRRATKNDYAITAGLMQPRSRGSITLHSADPIAPPKIVHNFLSDPHDRQALISGLRLIRKINAQSSFKDFTGPEVVPGSDCQSDEQFLAYIHKTLGSQYHPAGSCSMGTGANAVVDPQLRVRGIDGLRIADASIMPTVITGNTNGPCIMIGEKAADLAIEDGV